MPSPRPAKPVLPGGLLSATELNRLARSAARSSRLSAESPLRVTRGSEGDHLSLDTSGEIFLARLTTVQAGAGDLASLWLYGFKEQAFDPNTGIPLDAQPGRQDNLSTLASSYALENGNQLLTVPGDTPTGFVNPGPYVWMRRRKAEGGSPIYEFGGMAGGATHYFAALWTQVGVMLHPNDGVWIYPVMVGTSPVDFNAASPGWLQWPSDCPPQMFQMVNGYQSSQTYAVAPTGGSHDYYDLFPPAIAQLGGPLPSQWDATLPIYAAESQTPYAVIWPTPPGAWPPNADGSYTGYFLANQGLVLDSPYLVLGANQAGVIGGVLGNNPVVPGANFQLYLEAQSGAGSQAMYQGQSGSDGVGNIFLNGINVSLGAGSAGPPSPGTLDGGSLW